MMQGFAMTGFRLSEVGRYLLNRRQVASAVDLDGSTTPAAMSIDPAATRENR